MCRTPHWHPFMWLVPLSFCGAIGFLIWTLTWLVPFLHMMWLFNRGMPWA